QQTNSLRASGGMGGHFVAPHLQSIRPSGLRASTLLVTLDRTRVAFGAGLCLAAHLVQSFPAGFATRVGRRRGAMLLGAAHAERALTGHLARDPRRAGRGQSWLG